MTPLTPTIRTQATRANTPAELGKALSVWQTNQPVNLHERGFEQMKLLRLLLQSPSPVLQRLFDSEEGYQEFQGALRFYLSLVSPLPLNHAMLDDHITKTDVFLNQLIQDCLSHNEAANSSDSGYVKSLLQ